MISGKPKMTHVHNFHPHDHVSPRSCAILALFTMSLTTTLAMADTTNSTQVPIVPDRSNVSFSNIPVGVVTNPISGHIGVDIIMGQDVPLGITGDRPLAGDFNGDGKTDFVTFKAGQWAARSGVAPFPTLIQGVSLGKAGDIPLNGDFNGDRRADFVVFSAGQWAVRSGVSPYSYIALGLVFGKSGDTPLTGDFNSDGKTDFAIFSGGQWAVRSGVSPFSYIAQGVVLGKTGDIPLVGDFNRDGKADFAIFSGGQWAVRSGVSPYSYIAQGVVLGKTGDIPLVSDFNHDGRADFAIFSEGQWAVRSGVSPYSYISQGIALGKLGDTPLTGDFNGDRTADYVTVDYSVDNIGQWAVRSGVAPYSFITPTSYNPCHQSTDTYYKVCATANSGPVSYYKVEHFAPDSISYPNGIFVDNSNACVQGTSCAGQTLTHYWGRKVSSIALELYSYDPTVGGARLEMACCSYFANGGVYTDPVGTITLPQQGQPGTVYFNGYFTGTNIAMRTFGVDVFGTGTPGASTSGGASLYGFSSTATGTDGYYRTTPLYAGQYKTYLNEKGRSARSIVYYLWNVNVGDIFDFAADVPCFGVSQPHSPVDDHILTSQECSSLWAQP